MSMNHGRKHAPDAPYVSAWRVLKKIFDLDRRRIWGGRDAIQRTQRENLATLLRFAAERCPFYAERFAGRDLGSIGLEDFPPVDKHTVMDNFDRLVTDPGVTREEVARFVSDPARIGQLLKGRYVASHTSGSSGVRGLFLVDQWGWEMGQALGLAGGTFPSFRFRDWLRILQAPFRHIPAVAVIPMGGHYASPLMAMLRAPLVNRVIDLHLLEITEPFDAIVRELNRLRPFGVHSYPSMLDVLARMQERRELNIRPRVITSGGEPFLEDTRRRILRAWPGATIHDIYACTEVLSIAQTCVHGTHHVNEDWILLENVDGDGRPVPMGERGDKVLVTSLFNYLLPVIRYELTDSVILDDTPCLCGQPLASIQILGRTNHTLTLPGASGGDVTILPTPLLVAFMDVHGLRQYQVIQEERAHLHVNYAVEDGRDPEAVRLGIAEMLAAYFRKHHARADIRLSFSVVPEIPRDPRTHKVMQIINKCG